MRPVNKGSVPTDANNTPIIVKKHTEWRGYLVDRLGSYCSYCERRLNDLPQVEHVVAQKIDPSKELDWDNLLLSCGPCNQTKWNKPCSSITHYLPHFHNTYLPFTFVGRQNDNNPAVFVECNTYLLLPALTKAQATIDLCGLNRDTRDADNLTKISDLRWHHRHEAFIAALLWREEWKNFGHQTPSRFLRLFETAVKPYGFFSVWFFVFNEEPIVKAALIAMFLGTAPNCFDDNFNPVWRNAPTEI